MAQYIDKDALVAEIEKLVDKGKYHEEYDCAYRDGNNGALYALKGKVNSLEVKEVDLDAEWKKYFEHRGDMATVNIKHLAKHFFELALSLKNS
jgi:hypothetical protein